MLVKERVVCFDKEDEAKHFFNQNNGLEVMKRAIVTYDKILKLWIVQVFGFEEEDND